MFKNIGTLSKAIIISSSLLVSGCSDKELNESRNVKDKIENILNLEQLTINELVIELNEMTFVLKSQREKVSYEIIRLKNLGVDGYKSNKDKVNKSNELIDKYDLMLFEVKSLLKKLDNGEIDNKEANIIFRQIEKEGGFLFDTFSYNGYNFINKETETALK